METTVKNTTIDVTGKTAQGKTTSTRMGFWESMEFNRFGIIPVVLLLIGCIGGIAAGFGAFADLLRISLIAFPTIISLALILAVSPMRVIFYSAAIAIVCDVIAIAIGYPTHF